MISKLRHRMIWMFVVFTMLAYTVLLLLLMGNAILREQDAELDYIGNIADSVIEHLQRGGTLTEQDYSTYATKFQTWVYLSDDLSQQSGPECFSTPTSHLMSQIYSESNIKDMEEVVSNTISNSKISRTTYDWREDDSAGGWKEEYPQQAYLASEDPEWFLKELEDVQHTQKAEITFALEHLKDTVGTDLLQIVPKLWDRDIRSDATSHDTTAMPAYHLRVLAELLDGEYRCDSCFYNTSENTARLFRCNLDEIRQKPSEWALVMFDYHY